MLARRTCRSIVVRTLLLSGPLACLSVACGGSEFSAGDDLAGGAGSDSGGDSGSSGRSGGGGTQAGEDTGSPAAGRDGGSGSSSTPAGCRDYVEAYCDWEGRCGNGLIGSRDACLQLSESACEWYALPGVEIGSADFASCAAGYDAAECNAVPECELPAGSIENGLPCASYVQCQSGYCAGGSSGACGVCAPDPRGEAGARCSSFADCGVDLDCVAGECTEKAREGEACGAERGCSVARRETGNLVCIDGTCQVVGLLGEDCHEASGAMICGVGTACSNGICVQYVEADAGAPCGTFEDRVVACKDGLCTTLDESSSELECVAWPGPGEECDKIPNFQRCAVGLNCNEQGRCAWPTPVGPPVCE